MLIEKVADEIINELTEAGYMFDDKEGFISNMYDVSLMFKSTVTRERLIKTLGVKSEELYEDVDRLAMLIGYVTMITAIHMHKDGFNGREYMETFVKEIIS